jgi:hypothetical protein
LKASAMHFEVVSRTFQTSIVQGLGTFGGVACE